MSHRRVLPVLLPWLLALLPASARAQTSTAALSANIQPIARLTLSSSTLVFPDADPDLFPQVGASGGALAITARGRASAGGQVVLTVIASDDLRSGVNLIPASALTWTATGPGFVPGTLDKTSATAVARWTGSAIQNGTQTWLFRNLWSYATGIYTVTLTYTLTAP